MTITKSIWGPHGWKFFHFVALAYPINPLNEDKQNYYNFYIYFGKVLPCQNCIDNYKKHLDLHPLTDAVLSTRDTLLKWTIDIHNEVNKETGKTIYDYKTAINLIYNNFNDKSSQPNIIESFYSNKKSNNESNNKLNNESNKKNNNYILLFLIIFVIILIIIAVSYKNS